MAGSRRENGSAILPFGVKDRTKTRENTLKKNDKKNKLICIVAILIMVIILALYICSFAYANNHEQKSAWFKYYSEIITSFPGVVVTLASAVFACSFIKEILIPKILRTISAVVVVVLLATYWVGGFMHVISEVEKPPTSVVIGSGSGALGDNEGKYEIRQYVFDDDPFVEQVHEYLGIEEGTIQKDELVDKIALVVEEGLANQQASSDTRDEESMNAYAEYLALAEAQYDTYTTQRKRDWNIDTGYVIILIDIRLEDLGDALDYRINADGIYIDCENRRIIALYFKDEGDEYIKKSEHYHEKEDAIAQTEAVGEAQKAYEEGAEWCMKALRVAILEEKENKAKEILKVFKKIEEAAKSDKISNVYLAYKKVLNKTF